MGKKLTNPADTGSQDHGARRYRRPDARRFYEIVDGLSAILWEADAESWHFTSVSPQAERVLGFPAERWLSEDGFWIRHMHPADRAWAPEFCAAAVGEGRDHAFEYRALAADGRVVWIRDEVRVIKDGDGRPVRLQGVMIDVTARHLAEERGRRLATEKEARTAADAERRRLLELVHHLDGIVWEADAEAWRFTFVSEGADRLLGLPPERLLADPGCWSASLHADDRDGWDDFRRQCAEEDGEIHEFECRATTPDGRTLRLRNIVRTVRNEAGRPVSYRGLVVDVTRQVEAEEARERLVDELDARQQQLSASEERYRLLANLIPGHVWTARPDGRLDFVNDRALEYLGRSCASLRAHGWGESVHPDDRAPMLERWTWALDCGEEFEAEIRLRRSSGEYRWHIIRARPELDEGGRIVQWFGTTTDVDDQRLAEEAAHARERRERLLADASRLLATSFDYRSAVASVVNVILPALGDFCAVDLIGDGGATDRVAWRHVTPATAAWYEANGPDPAADAIEHVIAGVLSSGRAQWLPTGLADGGGSGEAQGLVELVRPLPCRSLIVAPLLIRGAVVGAMTFCVTESERRYTGADLLLAESLASRVGSAIGNARLYESARESRERLRAALDAAQMGTIRADLRTGTLEWDENMERLLGIAPGTGRRTIRECLVIVHAQDRRRVEKACRRCAETGADLDEEFRVLSRTRGVRWITAKGRTYPGEDGRPSYVVGACTDVTARRQREEEFRALAEGISQLVWLADATGSAYWFNQRWYEFTGTTFDEVRDGGWLDVYHPDHVERVTERMRGCLASGEVFEDTFPLRDGQGRYRWFLARALPIRDGDGAIQRWVCTHTDVTALREAEAARDEALARVRTERERLDEVFTHAPAAIAVTEGADHVVVVANPRFMALLGSRQVMGRPLPEAVPELEGQGFCERIDEVQASGEPHAAREVALRLDRRGDGTLEEGIFDVLHQPLTDAHGRVWATMTHAIDVTDRVRQREELATARTEADHANRAKSAFLAAISHDLRTPLNAVSGYASLVADGVYGPVDDVLQDVMFRIQHSIGYLLSLIDGILGFARLEAGSITFDVEPLPVDETLAGLASLIEPQIQAKGLAYRQLSGPPDVQMLADRERLTQVMLNVLTNAMKFTDVGGITIDWEATDSAVLTHIRDSGRGIPGDQLAAIFEPFVQAGEDEGEAHHGIGLGLAISRSLARGMGGELTVESEVGRGSTFTLSLPRA